MYRYEVLCETLAEVGDGVVQEILLEDYFSTANPEDAACAAALLGGQSLVAALQPRLEVAWCGATLLDAAARADLRGALLAIARAVACAHPLPLPATDESLARWLEGALSRLSSLAVRAHHCAFWTLIPGRDLTRLRHLFGSRPRIAPDRLARAWGAARARRAA